HELGRHEEARQVYQRVLNDLDPTNRAALWNLGLLLEAQDPGRAIELYGRIAELHPAAQDAWFRIGFIRLQRKEYRPANAAFQACLQVEPKNCEALLNVGIAHWRSGNPAAAEQTFRQILALAPKSAEALRALAA